jgi:signal transduction histidine kinase
VRQQKITLPEATSEPRPPSLDPIRVEQFLDLQRDLLVTSADPEGLAPRLVQRFAVFLRVPGAALGAVRDGCYRVLATYGMGRSYAVRYEARSPRDSELAPALASGQPLVLPEPEEADGPLQTIFLPFRTLESVGGLQLVVPAGGMFADEDLQLARALAVLAGVALTNAERCQRLAQLARLKGDALTAMAHDLRAPLNALVGYAALLGEGAYGALNDEQRAVSATLERQALELVDLLGATLDVARLETGQLSVRTEEFALAELLAALRNGTFARAGREGRLSFSVPADLPQLRTDRVKVKEIVQNLVDNALKHGGEGTVEVEVTHAPDRQTVRITVRDRGPGIAADVLPHLFEAFRPGARAPGSGTGFGLYIVRCFAEALGGRVAARSLPGEGTAVTVEFPLAAARGQL